MMGEEEAESWYEEQKRALLEKFMAAIEAKEHTEEAEKRYTKDLNELFEKYKKLKMGLIAESIRKAKEVAARRVAKPGKLQELKARIAALAKRGKK